jgi:hypothetical protein
LSLMGRKLPEMTATGVLDTWPTTNNINARVVL